MKRTLTFIVLSRDATDSRELSRALGAHPGASLLMTSDDAEQVFTETCRLRPSAVVINLNHMGEPALKLVQRIVNECPVDRRDLRFERVVAGPDSAQHALRCTRFHSPSHQRRRADHCNRANFGVLARTWDDEPKKRGRAIAVFSQ